MADGETLQTRLSLLKSFVIIFECGLHLLSAWSPWLGAQCCAPEQKCLLCVSLISVLLAVVLFHEEEDRSRLG